MTTEGLRLNNDHDERNYDQRAEQRYLCRSEMQLSADDDLQLCLLTLTSRLEDLRHGCRVSAAFLSVSLYAQTFGLNKQPLSSRSVFRVCSSDKFLSDV